MPALTDKVVVVTGGPRGLGYAMAQAFAAAGAAVMLGARAQAMVGQAANTLEQRGYRAGGFPVDVSYRDQVEALASHAVHTFGRIDVWV